MWLSNSSIGRKVVMSVTGIALVLFLTFHASMNVVALFSKEGYNMICEFLGANWYAVVATMGLAALVAIHFIYAFWLTLQNRKARGNNRYAVTDKPAKVEWASQNMLVLGIIVFLGMLLHLYNFWYNMMFAELIGAEVTPAPTDGYGYIVQTFSNPVYTVIYLVWLVAIWFHLNHGIWSAFQTLGLSGKIWFSRLRVISTVYTTIVMLMFAVVALKFSICGGECCASACCAEPVPACCQEAAQPECCAEHAACNHEATSECCKAENEGCCQEGNGECSKKAEGKCCKEAAAAAENN